MLLTVVLYCGEVGVEVGGLAALQGVAGRPYGQLQGQRLVSEPANIRSSQVMEYMTCSHTGTGEW